MERCEARSCGTVKRDASQQTARILMAFTSSCKRGGPGVYSRSEVNYPLFWLLVGRCLANRLMQQPQEWCEAYRC